ncbi:hypothetical protein [Shewanella khirikhana]|uniref:Uncharacterized protein n=1 Tax=Shewanella khirikhana TaxID=1965282 RepID=A0ABN5TSQ4_9GAMM|nr:hypothetical protein [Shewanella khirikhana]AZQ10156.1 hypothetical protein STH12_01020 [Shewanella khirikhana]
MTQRIQIDDTGWTLLSTGKTRGLIENETGRAVKVRIEAVGVVPSNSETWGHNLNIAKYFTWEKASLGADIYARATEGSGYLLVSEG